MVLIIIEIQLELGVGEEGVLSELEDNSEVKFWVKIDELDMINELETFLITLGYPFSYSGHSFELSEPIILGMPRLRQI